MKRFFKQNWAYLLLGFTILVLFFLRLYNLTILPVFADEAIYIRWAQVMRAEETLRFLPLSDGKQPLFMWVMIPFFKFIRDPLVAGRLVSVLSGFGTMVGIGLTSWLLFGNKKVALAASAIYAVTPFTFFFDRMSLVDSMLSMFGIWTFIFAYLAYTKKRLDFAMIAGFMLGGAWLTKSPALFFALLLPTLWLFLKNPKSLTKVIPLTLVTVVIGYGFYNILRLGPNFSLIASRNLDYVYPISHFFVSPLDPLKPWLLQVWQWLVMMGPWPLLVLTLLGILVNWKKNWKQTLILFIWFLGPIVIEAEFAKVFTARYILFSLPYLIIIAGSLFTTDRKNWLRISAFVLAFFVAQSLIFDKNLLVSPEKANLPRSERSGYLEEWTAGQGIKETAEYIKSQHNKNPSQKIVVGTEGFFGTLPDGLQIYLNDFPNVIAIGVGLNFDSVPKPLSESKKAGNTTYLVVNKSRYGRNPGPYGLKIISEYPKAQNPEGGRDELFLMELSK